MGWLESVVLLEGDDGRRRLVLRGEVEDVAHRRRPERVDGLRVVAHHRDALPVGLELAQDVRLQAVGVLVLVDQDVVETLPGLGRQGRLVHHHPPVEQEIVEVEHVAGALGLDVGSEELPQLFLPFQVVGEGLPQAIGEWGLRVDHARVDGQAGRLAWEALLGLGQPELVPDQIEQVGGILAVEDGEGGIEAE